MTKLKKNRLKNKQFFRYRFLIYSIVQFSIKYSFCLTIDEVQHQNAIIPLLYFQIFLLNPIILHMYLIKFIRLFKKFEKWIHYVLLWSSSIHVLLNVCKGIYGRQYWYERKSFRIIIYLTFSNIFVFLIELRSNRPEY